MLKISRERARGVLVMIGFWVVCVCVFAFLLEFVSWLILAGHGLFFEKTHAAENNAAYGNATWVNALRKEEHERLRLHSQYLPFVIWGNREWHGKYINTDASELGIWRRTANPDR